MMSVEFVPFFIGRSVCTTVYNECCKVAAYVHETVSSGRLRIGLLRTTCHGDGNIIYYYRLPGVDYAHAKTEIDFTRFTCIGYRLISTFRINKRFTDIQQQQQQQHCTAYYSPNIIYLFNPYLKKKKNIFKLIKFH